jgi:uncharacterized protein YndB with AHSA1/START domain
MRQSNTDRIEKRIVLKATRQRVWQALTTVEEFNSWFRVALEGTFSPGARLQGPITYEGYEHLTMEMTIERMEPESLLTWRWKPGTDASLAAETRVTFELRDVEGGTELTLTESGFDSLPPDQRETAFRGNDEGWDEQMSNIRRHLGEEP